MKRSLPPIALILYVAFGAVLLIQMMIKPSYPGGWKIISGDGLLRWNADREEMTLYQHSKHLYLKMGTHDLSKLNVISSVPDSQVLLRVDSGGPSILSGKLPASGSILLINPNGIIVDSSAVIDVGMAAILSTLDITDQDLPNGADFQILPQTAAGKSGLGTMTTEDGEVVLLGNFVEHPGAAGFGTEQRIRASPSKTDAGTQFIFAEPPKEN